MKDMALAARCYLVSVSVAGLVLFVLLGLHAPPVASYEVLGLFAVLSLLGELRGIKAPLGAEGIDLTFSTAFIFAILMSYGVFYAAAASLVASVICDLLARKALWKTIFNGSQFVLVSVVSGAVFERLSGTSHLDLANSFSEPGQLLAAGAAALTYFALNTLLLSSAIGLIEDISIFRLIRQESGYQVMGSVGMFGLAPIAVVIAGRSVWLLPVLVIPLAVAYQSTRLSIAKEHQALHDSLTGLPNREMFRQRAIEAITGDRSTAGTSTVVMLIDLDRFKEINDTLGHGTGDLVLRELGPRLLAAVGGEATIARLGGDEFGVILPAIADVKRAEQSAREVLDAIRQPLVMQGLDLEIAASIGIAWQDGDDDDADSLIQKADIAMYSAKEAGSGYAVYTAMLDHTSPMQLSLVSQLRQAIETAALEVYYQPKVAVATGRVAGAEALVRWNHPSRGLVDPDDFIPIAEQSGLIRDLTRFVLGESVAANARWRSAGHDLPISVNISARTLHDLDLPNLISGLIGTAEVPAAHLVLEITESTIMADPVAAISALEQLRSIGARVSLDDYGTGHSSLAQLKTLPIDELKLDKSFITNMGADTSDALIAQSTIDLAHRLDLRVVAEGVETPDTWDLLRSMGCDQAQGYYFARPQPESAFIRWVDQNCRRHLPRATEPSGPANPALTTSASI